MQKFRPQLLSLTVKILRAFLFLLIVSAALAAQSHPADTPNPPQAPSSEFSHARQLLNEGKYDEAIAALQQLSTDARPKGLAHELGMAYYRKGDYFHAADSFKKALQQNAQDSESTQRLGISYYLAGNPSAAIPYLEKVQTWYSRANVDASYILGQCYIQTKDYPHARLAFAKMFDLAPDSAGSYLLTARMLFRQEFEPVALEYAQRAIALDPKLPRAHQLLGEIHLFESKIPEAIADFEAELALNPSDAATYYKLADADSRIQKFDDAEKLLQRAIWLDPTSTGPYVLMGKVLEKKGEPELAIRALRHAAAMDPNNPITHHLLGQAYRDLGNTEEAERELKLAGQLEGAADSK
jgi:tetratricopeptide (TPR) repeat protein